MDTGEETPPEGDGGFDDTDDAMSEDDQDDDSEGDPDAAAAAAALERDDALPVHVRRGPPADDEEADDDDADDDADDEEEEEEEHGDEEHGDDETGVPPELEAAAAAADAPRAAHAAALAAIRRAHAVRATPLLAEWLLRAWRRQMVSMALTTDEWLAFSRDAQAVAMPWDDLFEDLAVAVGQRPVSPQLWLELARAAFGFGGDESVEKMRRVLSDAVDVAGLDLSQGQRLWEASIAFEADVGDEAKQLALWLKRLATPLTWSESALLGFKTKYTAADRKRGEAAHAAALKLRKLREPHEGAVSRAADDEARCDAWLAYTA
ncbi:hypothetical protein M885DRAFT_58940 [Pelagophyceae sp. CCMP2097]|nr:hypothetical protein M885DRAFT_58940 [Pelagophyceae sp. CCMP2097]